MIPRSRHVERVARNTKAIIILIEVIAAIIVGSALMDCLLHLGWGYHWKDVGIGAGIMLWGGIVYACCRAVFRFVGSGL
ncbi:hypothetical protein BH09PSE3_BH09PSE3_04140 [soil metagenome]